MTWASSRHASPIGAPLLGNVPKEGPKREVLRSARVGKRPNLYTCWLICGHVSMTRSRVGMRPPTLVRCPDCREHREASHA